MASITLDANPPDLGASGPASGGAAAGPAAAGVAVVSGKTLADFAKAAENAEQKVERALKTMIQEEEDQADAIRDYEGNRGDASLRQAVSVATTDLFNAKNALELAKMEAEESRTLYLQEIAKFGIKDDMNLNGLNTHSNGTGIPGGLDAIGAAAAKLFLPDHRLSTDEAKFELEKLKTQYKARKAAIETWSDARIAESKADFMKSSDLVVLKSRVKSRLSHAKNKTDQYRGVVKKLYKKYKKDYDERVINKNQMMQIATWARNKYQLSRDRYNAFKGRVINQYMTTISQMNSLKQSKKDMAKKAKEMAKDQLKLNREAYSKQKAAILKLAKESAAAVKGFQLGLPILENIGADDLPLDTIGGLDPFDAEGDLDGLDDML